MSTHTQTRGHTSSWLVDVTRFYDKTMMVYHTLRPIARRTRLVLAPGQGC